MPVDRIRVGNILDSSAQTLVNTVNTVGVMGKGIALEFKNRFPDMFDDYVKRCERREVKLGEPYLFERLIPPWIINFPTKEHWRAVSRLDAIVQGLRFMQSHIDEWGVESLAVPPLGCGNGQLEWRVVGPELYRHLNDLTIPVELYAPLGASQAELDPSFLSRPVSLDDLNSEESKLDSSLILLAEVVARLATSAHAWPVGRTRFQKLAFFATAAGLPTNLDFVERSYGPFSYDLKPALSRLVNNGVLKEVKSGNLLRLTPGPTFNDARSRYRDLISLHEETIARTVDLMLRLDPRRLELAATVQFVAGALGQRGNGELIDAAILNEVQRWKKGRRPPFANEEISEVVVSLDSLSWLNVKKTRARPLREDLPSFA